jgi:hypothetical protein
MMARTQNHKGGDLFARPVSRKEEKAAPRRPLSPRPRVCAFCGHVAPFGKGNVREPETIVWACREHRKNLG